MAVGIQGNLNKFKFERNVDWRISFPDLFNLGKLEQADGIMGLNWCFAKSVAFPVSLIDVDSDVLTGFYKSIIVSPVVTTEIYVDSEGMIENALRLWNLAAFTDDGFMPPPRVESPPEGSSLTDFAVQRIIISKINPISETKAMEVLRKKAAMRSAGSEDSAENEEEFNSIHAIETYTFWGYLAKVPDYSGDSSARIRTLLLTFKVTNVGRETGHSTKYVTDKSGFFYAPCN